ncbi:type I polyketide synthase [Tsukamurella soli]|uniref:type I polyketide synthase n=1 Tax=Tsukamurella soli TaxID=644556 RepID=UPI003607FA04
MTGSAAPDRRAIITDALRRIDDLTARLKTAEEGILEPIAVVGIGCRLPGGVWGPDDYWQLLEEGRDGVVRVPGERWDADALYSADHTVPGTICNREGGFLTGWDPAEFDAEFFGISPREAAGMDPQQRLLLEVAWEAIEHAGIVPATLRGTRTGVYVGLTTNDYSLTFAGDLAPEEIDPYVPFGSAHNFAAGRLSYFLGLNGPAIVLDTACSSSLAAVHLACEGLRRRQSDAALVAGVNLVLSPENSIACSRWGMLAPDGRCKAFDAAADGYVRSEGVGVVVLKRLSDAQRDGDRVLAVVRGTAVNQDGASSGQTVPNGPAQQALLRQALAASRLAPSDIDYIEAHGTGTALGDPIELDTLDRVFGDRAGSAPLVVGTVKTNLGHLESAAGIAGFIKTVLSVRAARIPRLLHFSELTPHACDGAARFVFPTDSLAWPNPAQEPARPRRAGVSSFGVSGTNAHVVVEQAPDSTTPVPEHGAPQSVSRLLITGKTPGRVAASAAALADWLTGDGAAVPLPDVAHALADQRARFPRSASVIAADREQAVAGLRAVAGGYPLPGVVPVHEGVCRPGIVFTFSGQGSQWAGMARRLLRDEPAFAAAVDEIEPDFVEVVGFSLRDVLESGVAVAGIDRIQPVLVGLQLALVALWRAYGAVPDAVIGHSMGEVAAAVVAGALSRRDGLKVIATRSRLMREHLAGRGAMALLGLPAAEVADLLRAAGPAFDQVSVAVVASPRQTAVAGPPDQIDAVIAAVAARELLARRVEVDVASHHATVDPILGALRAELAGLTPSAPTIPVYSTVRPGETAPVFDADYWVDNLRKPVQFASAVAAASERFGTFVEISPHPILAYAVDDTLAAAHHHTLGTLARDTHDGVTFHTNLAAAQGASPSLPTPPVRRHVALPTMAWQRGRYWITPARPKPRGDSAGAPAAVPDGGPHGWFLELDHPVRPLAPATGTPAERWVVVADGDHGADLAAALGAGATALTPADLADPARPTSFAAAERVLFAPAATLETFDPAAAQRLFVVLGRLAALLRGSGARLTILTRNAQPAADGDRVDPAHAGLWGAGRTLALEQPAEWGGLIDVDAAVPARLAARCVLDESTAADEEDQVVYRAGVRRVPRLRRASAPAALTALEPGHASLVVGGTGNIGPHLIRQLARMGAGTIVVVSRRGGLPDGLAEELGATATLVSVAADAADPAAMAAVFDRFGVDLPPLDGVYVASLAGGAGQIADLTADEIAGMFRPKVDAVAVLHELTLATPARRFVLFSSVTGVLGSRWLGHYTAANAYVDAFAYARRAAGLPATVVDWGLFASWAQAQPETAAAGLEPMPNDAAVRVLAHALAPGAPTRSIIAGADWPRLAEAYRMRGTLRVVDDLLVQGSQGASESAAVVAISDLDTPRPGTLLGTERPDGAGGREWLARLDPAARPYPGAHRVRGVEVVPVSVLVATLLAAAEAGGSAVADVRLEYPVVLDRPRALRVSVSAAGGIVLATNATGEPDGWVRHASAASTANDSRGDHDTHDRDAVDRAAVERSDVEGADAVPAYDAAAAEGLARAWGSRVGPTPGRSGRTTPDPGHSAPR